MPSLDPKQSYDTPITLFVKMSTSWSDDDTCGVEITPINTLSWIKWQLISICLVLSWKARFPAIKIADWLAQCIDIGIGVVMPKSCTKDCNHTISLVVAAIAWYLDSTFEQEMTFCFRERQVTRLPPTYVQYGVVDFWSPLSPTYPISE